MSRWPQGEPELRPGRSPGLARWLHPLPRPDPRGTPGVPIVTAPDVDNGETVNPDFSMGQYS